MQAWRAECAGRVLSDSGLRTSFTLIRSLIYQEQRGKLLEAVTASRRYKCGSFTLCHLDWLVLSWSLWNLTGGLNYIFRQFWQTEHGQLNSGWTVPRWLPRYYYVWTGRSCYAGFFSQAMHERRKKHSTAFFTNIKHLLIVRQIFICLYKLNMFLTSL